MTIIGRNGVDVNIIPKWLKKLNFRLLGFKDVGVYTITLIIRDDGSREIVVNKSADKVEHLGAD